MWCHVALTACFYFSVGDVSVAGSGTPIKPSHGHTVNLMCTVTAPDVFDKWDNELYTSSIKDDPNLEFTESGNNHNIRIKSMNVYLAGVWTCYSTQGNNDSIIVDVARKSWGLLYIVFLFCLLDNSGESSNNHSIGIILVLAVQCDMVLRFLGELIYDGNTLTNLKLIFQI